MLATHHNDGIAGGDVETLIIGLLLTAVLAFFVWFGCRAAGRPDLGSIGAAAIVIIGALLTILAVL